MGKHRLLEHLRTLRGFFFMGAGDFAGGLVEALCACLDAGAVVSSSSVQHAFDAALRVRALEFRI